MDGWIIEIIKRTAVTPVHAGVALFGAKSRQVSTLRAGKYHIKAAHCNNRIIALSSQ